MTKSRFSSLHRDLQIPNDRQAILEVLCDWGLHLVWEDFVEAPDEQFSFMRKGRA